MNNRFFASQKKEFTVNLMTWDLERSTAYEKYTPELYTPLQLPELLAQSTNFFRDWIVVRFVVHPDGKLVFGKEGPPNESIPAHSQMAEKRALDGYSQPFCIAAGNCFFDKTGKLQMINHKSGDFRPSFASLQYAIQALKDNNIVFSDSFLIQELDEKNGAEIKAHTFPSDSISLLLPEAEEKNTEVKPPVNDRIMVDTASVSSFDTKGFFDLINSIKPKAIGNVNDRIMVDTASVSSFDTKECSSLMNSIKSEAKGRLAHFSIFTGKENSQVVVKDFVLIKK